VAAADDDDVVTMEGLGHPRIIARGGRRHVAIAIRLPGGGGAAIQACARVRHRLAAGIKKGPNVPRHSAPGIPDVRATSPVPILVGAPDALPRRVQGR
jgi:hypothetical protein